MLVGRYGWHLRDAGDTKGEGPTVVNVFSFSGTFRIPNVNKTPCPPLLRTEEQLMLELTYPEAHQVFYVVRDTSDGYVLW